MSASRLLATLVWLAIICSQVSGAQINGESEIKSAAPRAVLDLVKIHESKRPVECSGAKSVDLAPESRIVAVYFERDENKGSLMNFESEKLEVNKTKQSQDFDTHVEPPSTVVSEPPVGDQQQPSSTEAPRPSPAPSSPGPSSELPEESSASSSPAPSSSSSSSSTTSTTSTTTTTEQPDRPEPDFPGSVGSHTIRSGASVFCGEANPNGKSNKRLILDRIVGGRKTEPGEFPFQVRLNIRSRRGSGICGGVILDERHILTAAHCMTACVSQYLTTATIETSGVHATIGDHSIKSNDGELEIDIERITAHNNNSPISSQAINDSAEMKAILSLRSLLPDLKPETVGVDRSRPTARTLRQWFDALDLDSPKAWNPNNTPVTQVELTTVPPEGPPVV